MPSAKSYSVVFQPSGVRVSCQPGQTLLEAASAQGVMVRKACRNGVCEVCSAQFIRGNFVFTSHLGQQLLDQKSQVLCCIAQPITDSELYMPSVQHPDSKPQMDLAMQVESVSQLNQDVYRVRLLAPAGKALDFWPGQYLMLEVPAVDNTQETKQLPYSIASAPGSLTGQDPRALELQIAANSETAQRVVDYLKSETLVRVSLPMGDCFVTDRMLEEWTDQPLLLVASGTGFAQIKALAEGILAWQPDRALDLYWSNRDADGFYMAELIDEWTEQYPNLTYHPIVEADSGGWNGRSGWIYQVIQQDYADLSDVQIFACGSPNMVYGTLDQLEANGLTEDRVHADVFSYMPRPPKNSVIDGKTENPE